MLIQYGNEFILFCELEELTTSQLRQIVNSDENPERRKFAAIILFKRLQPKPTENDCNECDKLGVQLTKCVRLNASYLKELKETRSKLFKKQFE